MVPSLYSRNIWPHFNDSIRHCFRIVVVCVFFSPPGDRRVLSINGSFLYLRAQGSAYRNCSVSIGGKTRRWAGSEQRTSGPSTLIAQWVQETARLNISAYIYLKQNDSRTFLQSKLISTQEDDEREEDWGRGRKLGFYVLQRLLAVGWSNTFN